MECPERFIMVPNSILASSLSPTAKLVFGLIYSFSKHGCKLTNKQIAKRCGISTRRVSDVLSELARHSAIHTLTKASSRLLYPTQDAAKAHAESCAPPTQDAAWRKKIYSRYTQRDLDRSASESADETYKPLVDSLFRDYQIRNGGTNPTWDASDYQQLRKLREKHAISEILRRWPFFLDSTEHFIVSQGSRLRWFCTNFDRFKDGAVLEKEPALHFDLQAEKVTHDTLREFYKRNPPVVRPALPDVPRPNDPAPAEKLHGGAGRLLASGSPGRGETGDQEVRPDANASADPEGAERHHAIGEAVTRLAAMRKM